MTSMLAGEVLTVGRVATLEVENADSVSSLRIVDSPEFGSVSVNPDNSLSVVLMDPANTSDFSFTYEVERQDGTIEQIISTHDVQAGSQNGGWGQGDFYMLEVDENDDVIVETGVNHRPVYISGSDDALSRADIGALEGLSEGDITDQWLVDHPDYGSNEDMALDADAGMGVWYATTDGQDTSNWLLFESGYTYSDLGRLVARGSSGEDELRPLHITSYGEGDRPVLDTQVMIFQEDSENIVFSNLHFGDRITSLAGNNLIFDNVEFSGEVSIHNGEGVTIRDSEQYDVVREAPRDGGDTFQPHADRISGLYIQSSEGVLLEQNIWDHNGWVSGYAYDGDADFGQAPSQYSHNVYIQYNTLDITFRDNITMQSASFGAQLRGGAFIEDNLFLHNNVGVNFLGGEDGEGNYTLFTSNVVTSAQYNEALLIGAGSRGVEDQSNQSTLLGNIITHLADPNDPDSLAARPYSHGSINGAENTYYNDTIIYNWHGNITSLDEVTETNIEGLDPAELDQTTIQLFTASLLGDPQAGVAELAVFLRQSEGLSDTMTDAEVINAYFQDSFGITLNERFQAETARFVPNELADGVRWDNRLNWDSEDLPGSVAGDSVNLGGNWVTYGGTNTLENLDFGDGGTLVVNHGSLTVNGVLETGTRGGTFDIDDAGQMHINGYSDTDRLILNVDGGRFVNDGHVSGTVEANLTDGQTVLATDGGVFDVTSTSTLTVTGSEAQIGFDGDAGGTAVLRFAEDAGLRFDADVDGFSTISEFRSGHFGDAPDVDSGIALNGVDLTLDVTEMNGTEGAFVLADVDALFGSFGSINILGLAQHQSASLVLDYENDTLTLNIFESVGVNNIVSVSTVGDEADGLDGTELWNALSGNIVIYGSSGADLIRGGYGIDSLFGGDGADTLEGGDGGDLLDGGQGYDHIWGGSGYDRILGGASADRVYGGAGNDWISGGSNSGMTFDGLWGEAGNDTIVGDGGFDMLDGGDGNDLLDGGLQADNLYGRDGNDVLRGGQGLDRLFGGTGDDLSHGGDDNDGLFGEAGNDTLYGEAGNDRFFGGSGNDRIFGGADNDTINGGSGFDTIDGGTGNDLLFGRFNADIFVFADGHGQDTIGDFAALNDFERIDLRDVSAISGLSDLDLFSSTDGAATQSGSDVLIATGGSDWIVLSDTNLSDLDALDFIF